MTKGNLEARHGNEFTPPSHDEMRALHTAYAEFITAEPWWEIDDGHIVAHHHAEYGDAHTVIFGRLGQAAGLNIFVGPEGFNQAMVMLQGGPLHAMDLDPPDEAPLNPEEMDAITAVLGDREDLTDQERRQIREAGMRYQGRGEWPCISRATQGFMPSEVDQREARFAALVMRDIVAIAAQIDDQNLDPERWTNFANFLHSTFNDGRWHYEWKRHPKKMPGNPETVHVPVKEIRAMPELHESWIVGELTQAVVLKPEISHRRFPYRYQVAVDARTGNVAATSLPNGPVGYQHRQHMLHSSMQTQGGRPNIIIAHDALTAVALFPVCRELDLPFAVASDRHPTFELLEAESP